MILVNTIQHHGVSSHYSPCPPCCTGLSINQLQQIFDQHEVVADLRTWESIVKVCRLFLYKTFFFILPSCRPRCRHTTMLISQQYWRLQTWQNKQAFTAASLVWQYRQTDIHDINSTEMKNWNSNIFNISKQISCMLSHSGALYKTWPLKVFDDMRVVNRLLMAVNGYRSRGVYMYGVGSYKLAAVMK